MRVYTIWFKLPRKEWHITRSCVILIRLYPEQLKTLLCESWNAAVLNSGETNTAAGKSWFNCYTSSLKENEKQKVQYHPVNNTYKIAKM